MLTVTAQEKQRALQRMKLIATGAFILMVAIFAVSRPFGAEPIIWVVRWDHINAFAESAMVGALADWFAVVALFRHPMGIPIWHTAIIPRKKNDIGRNLGNFVETRLLSVENLTHEIGRFSVSETLRSWLSDEEGCRKGGAWLAEGIAVVARALDDRSVERLLREMINNRLHQVNASELLAGGLDLLIASNRYEDLADEVLRRFAEWVPSHRGTIEEFIERSVQRTLRWGSKLVPQRTIDRATDQTLTALIEVLTLAASDPDHPLRRDLNERMRELAVRLRNDPEWTERVNLWKDEMIESPAVAAGIESLWSSLRAWIAEDIEKPDSTIHAYALRGVESFRDRLESDTDLRQTLDGQLRSIVVTLLNRNHGVIGGMIRKVVDSWDGERLSREIELNLGRDLQYIRLNGTFIGGLVGLLIHLLWG